MNINLIWKIIVVAGSLLVALAGSLGVIKWKHDNKWEEMTEEFIESQTGLDIDLSPSDPDGEIAGI